jgi:hypothetical protein
VRFQRHLTKENWSITIAAVRTDVLAGILKAFDVALATLGAKIAIASLERGDKENNLHLQAAAAICWNKEEAKALAKHLRGLLSLEAEYPDLSFKVQVKAFEVGQTWLGMVGYCQKWRDFREYRIISRGMHADDLKRGQLFLTVYRSDYTKYKLVLDMSNIFKCSYAHWTATRKPEFVPFTELLHSMLQSGDFVVSGKLLSSAPLNRARAEEAWKTLLRPYNTTVEQTTAIFYGSAAKTIQTTVDALPRYSLEDFQPSEADALLLPLLQHNLVKRRHNVARIGPPGCGKSCLIQTLTMQHGVQFFGTADELREVAPDVQFVVLDDFDFSSFSRDDMKRLLDREFDTQRVKVRYKDATLSRKMTRVVLCNHLPECMDDPAVRERIDIYTVHSRLFPIERSKKFRGTHLLNTEEAYDQDEDTDIQKLAWSYGAQKKRAEKVQHGFRNYYETHCFGLC